jgi:hypothetical protein
MNLETIRYIARKKGVAPGALSKIQLVRRIQLEEGNLSCFATPESLRCHQFNCMWREDCLSLAGKLRS